MQLRFADGVVPEDDTDQGIVLLITDQEVRLPANVVLLDRAGEEVASHPFPACNRRQPCRSLEDRRSR